MDSVAPEKMQPDRDLKPFIFPVGMLCQVQARKCSGRSQEK